MPDKTSPYERKIKKTWWQLHWAECTIILVGIISINLIFIAEIYRKTDTVDAATAGQLGDFVGGYIGTFFALVSVVFLYSTLKVQRQTSSIEKFENKYFELIQLHRNNLSEIVIGKDSGRKVFVLLIRELRVILIHVKELAAKHKLNLSNDKSIVVSYIVLFFGVGPNSSRMLKSALKEYDDSFINELEQLLNDKATKLRAKSERGFKYTPFEGHQSRLGHYYRHLYQTICYVDNQRIDIDKYEYIKTIRAQLSTHEQALLLINSLAPFGKKWQEKNLILRYKFVKNIPDDFFNKSTEIEIEKYFPNDYFEWQA